jgi:hypothetical protein
MGLIYDSADSSRMKAGLSANLDAACTVLGDAESASRRLLSALGTGELSGQGYAAVDALFSQVIAPSLRDTKSEIESLQKDLEKYEWADSKVSHFGVLKEDELNVQLEATKRQRDATEHLIEVNTAAASAIPMPLFAEGIELFNTRLELVLTQLQNDVRDLEDRLGALKEFDAATRGLFLTGAPSRTVTSAAAASAAKPDPKKTWSVFELMNLLTLLSPSDIQRILTNNPDLAQQFWDTPPPPEVVAAWWKTLDPEQRENWCQAAPTIIGNLPGLDADTRIHANMIQLQRDVYDRSIDPNSPRGIVLRDILKALDVAKIFGPGLDYERLARESDPARGLLSYNPTHEPPLAAIAVGETNAENSGKVTWTVPGMNSGLGNKNDTLSGWTNAAVNLYKRQGYLEPGVEHMVVAWIGYEPPTKDLTVVHGDHARAGALRLAAELDGQWAASSILGENPNPFTAVVGHSYGTTVVTDALRNDSALSHTVQSVVLLASAGVERSIPTADSLRVDGGAAHVYASQSSQDQVADIGRTGSGRGDPREESFGASVFSSEGDAANRLEPTDGHDVLGYGADRDGIGFLAHATAGHGYLNAGTEALHNTAAAALGLDCEINGGARVGKN